MLHFLRIFKNGMFGSKLQQFSGEGTFCLAVEFHRGRPAIIRATPSSLYVILFVTQTDPDIYLSARSIWSIIEAGHQEVAARTEAQATSPGLQYQLNRGKTCNVVINRPGEAGAVLQSPWSLIDWLIESVIIFKKLSIPNHKKLAFWENIHPHYVTHVRCNMSGVRGQVSGVREGLLSSF